MSFNNPLCQCSACLADRKALEGSQIDSEVSRVPEARKTLYGRLKPFLEFLAVGTASVIWLAVIGFCLTVVFADLSR